MPDEQTETETHSEGTNGVSMSAVDARAAFLAGDDAEKPAVKAKAAASVEVEDDDSDLDDNEDTDVADEADEDADLDDEEVEAKDEEKPDADTAKRMAQVRRTDKHVREQREKDFAARDRQFAQERDAFVAEWKPKVEAAEKFDRAVERINVDPIGVLRALGLKPEAYEHTSQILYTLSKAKDDPKAQAAVAKLIKDRELEDKLDSVTRKLEEQDKTAKQRDADAAASEKTQALVESFAKAASEKTPLVKSMLKSDAGAAKTDLARIAADLIDKTGEMPTPKQVAVAYEKERRGLLRKMGIDPKTVSASAGNAAIEKQDTKPTTKKVEKKSTEKPADDKKPKNPRDAFISGKYD
jgi:hypothetical protein